MLQPARDVMLLCPQAFGCEDRVGVGNCLGAQRLHEADKFHVPLATLAAVGEMFGDRGIGTFTASHDKVTIEQAFVLEVMRPTHHGLPPSRPRSFRAARKRWTRTVDSFNPVIALTSRGEQSP